MIYFVYAVIFLIGIGALTILIDLFNTLDRRLMNLALDRAERFKDTAILTAELLMLPLTLFVFALAAISIELSVFIFERFGSENRSPEVL